MNRVIYLIILISLCTLIIGCSKDSNVVTPDKEDNLPKMNIETFPNIGSINTDFNLKIKIEDELGNGILTTNKTNIDWNNDGVYDEEMIDSLNTTHSFSNLGLNIINVLVEDTLGRSLNKSDTVYVAEIANIVHNESISNQGNVSWSRDGSNRIAFDWRNDAYEHQIYVAKYPNGVPERVSIGNDSVCHQFAKLSPDGSKIAFRIAYGGISNYKIIDLETKEEKIIDIYAYNQFIWHPNGDGFFIRKWGSDFDLYYYNYVNNNEKFIASNIHSYCLSPDGEILAVATYLDGTHTKGLLKFYNYNENNFIGEYIIPNFGFKFDWAPNGKLISLGVQNDVIYIFNYETKETLSVQIGELNRIWHPSWSEDSTILAFEAREITKTSPYPDEIWGVSINNMLDKQ